MVLLLFIFECTFLFVLQAFMIKNPPKSSSSRIPRTRSTTTSRSSQSFLPLTQLLCVHVQPDVVVDIDLHR